MSLFPSVYRGKVVSNEDPLNMGRLKISCPVIYGDTNPDVWVFPRGVPAGIKSGLWLIPNPQDPVLISCIDGDPRVPLWEYGWWLKDKIPDDVAPGVYALVTPGGYRLDLNDNNKTIRLKNPKGFNLEIREDGIFLGKENKNLGKLFDDLFQLFEDTTVATPGGPVPFNNLSDYVTLREDIEQFLKTS